MDVFGIKVGFQFLNLPNTNLSLNTVCNYIKSNWYRFQYVFFTLSTILAYMCFVSGLCFQFSPVSFNSSSVSHYFLIFIISISTYLFLSSRSMYFFWGVREIDIRFLWVSIMHGRTIDFCLVCPITNPVKQINYCFVFTVLVAMEVGGAPSWS